jgi:hypothetical protein
MAEASWAMAAVVLLLGNALMGPDLLAHLSGS